MTSIYKIGVNLAMTSNAPGVLAALSKQVLGLNMSVGQLEKALGRIGPVLTAGLAGVAGAGIFAAMKTATDYGKVLIDQQDKLIRAGLTHAQVANLTADAYQKIAYAVPTATGADILKTVGELRTVTGSLDKAVAATPLALQAQSLLENVTGQDAEGAGFALWRSIEMKGLTAGNAAMQRVGQQLIETFIQNIAGAGGKLTANDYQLMAKRGGAYWAHATLAFLAGPMSVVAADMGGDAAGTTLATFGQFLTGATTLSKQQFETLDKLRLVNRRLVSVDRGGRVNMQPGAIVGSTQYSGDYFDWTQKVLLPALKAAGVKEGPQEDSLLAKIGRNRNTTRMLTMFSDPGFVSQIQKDLDIWRKGMTPGAAYGDFVRNDPRGVDSAFDKQYQSMMQAIGAPLEQAAIPVMSEVTKLFTAIGAFAQKHPNIVKELGFDVMLGPLAYVGDLFKSLGIVLTPLGKYLAPIPGEAEAFGMSIVKLTGVVSPAAHAADTLANAIANLGGDIEGAVKGLLGLGGLAGKTWAIPATPGYHPRNSLLHNQSYVRPALSPKHGATLIRADAGSKTILAMNGSSDWAASTQKLNTANSNSIPARSNTRGVLVPITLKVDGRVLTRIVTEGQIRAAKMPLGIHGAPDDYGSYVGPGTTMQPA